MTIKYQTLDGDPTTADDPKRGVWYSVSCTFWTDEWDKLALSGMTPVCPHCGCVGFETTAQGFAVSPEYEAKHIGYEAELMTIKNTKCMNRHKWMERFK